MKRVLFILMLMTIGLSAQAASLNIGGVAINVDGDLTNCKYGLSEGYFNFYSSSKRLVFYNAKTVSTSTYGIYSNVDGLTIVFNGNNTIESSKGIVLLGDTRMENNYSTGKVTVSSSFSSLNSPNTTKITNIVISRGTWIFNTFIGFCGKLTIENGADVTINNSGEAASILGLQGSPELTIDNSSLKVNGHNASRVATMPVVLKDCVIESPLRAVRVKEASVNGIYFPVYSNSDPALLYNTSGTPLKGNLTIKPGTAYGLWICGVQLNSLNYTYLWELEYYSSMQNVAYLYYTPSTKTLLMLNTTLLNSGYNLFPPIHNEIDGLIINTSGGTHLIGYSIDNGLYGFESSANCTITGGGLLNVSCGNTGHAIRVENSNMTINNAILTASGGTYGLYGNGNSKIYVSNSTLNISGTERAIYVENNGFDPEDNCYIITPTDGFKFDNSIYSIDASTSILIPATTVQTKQLTRYPLWINGKQITEANKNHIKSILNSNSAEGSITFSPPNKLLINNLKILPGGTLDDYFISTTLDELILDLTGISSMRATGKSLATTNNLTVTGTGSINIDTDDDNGIQVGGTLKITGSASFRGYGELLGISANKLVMTPGTQLIASAYSASGRSLLCNSAPQLDGVALPADMYYNPSLLCICYKANDQPVARNEVVINAKNVNTVATSIEEPDAFETDAPTRVYTTTGQLVWQGTGQPQLPSGIYIVNGTKVVIK